MQGFDGTTIVLGAAVMTAFVTVLLYLSVASGPSRQLKGRMAAVKQRWGPPSADNAAALPNLRVTETGSSLPWLDSLIKRLVPRPALLRERLDRTGYPISLVKYAACSIVVGVLASLGRAVFLDFPPVLALLFGVAAGVGVPHMVIGYLVARRIKKFIARFPEAIDLIVRGLKSGMPVTESIRNVAEEFDGPVGAEFRKVADRIKVGQTLDVALNEAAKRVGIAEFNFFVISLSVQRETGGNLAETLENLSDILRKRRQMVLKIKAMSSEAKASAMILGSLPFIMFLLLWVTGGEYVMTLFTDPRGMMAVGAGLGILMLGVLVMMKMVRFEI